MRETTILTVLPPEEWRERAAAHRSRVEPWTGPRLRRRLAGERDPVDDFLFDYYRLRPAQLARWHPGAGVGLLDPDEAFRESPDYLVSENIATVRPERLRRREPAIRTSLRVMESMSSRPARFTCFGMHEWAMVYGLEQSQVRHEQLPLRLPPADVRSVVDSVGLRCTHFDAFRFFTPEAENLQRRLSRSTQEFDEQSGCLHAGMDLYRYAYQAGPFLNSELVADCFEHARRARIVDMRASPYDVSSVGLEPLTVETADGRRRYANAQRTLAEAAGRLRTRLIRELRALLPERDETPDQHETPDQNQLPDQHEAPAAAVSRRSC